MVTWLVELTGGLTNVGAAPAWGHCQATELLLSSCYSQRNKELYCGLVWCGVVWSTVSVGDIIRGRSYLTRVTTLDHHHQADQTTDQSEAFVTSHTSRLLAAPLSVPV